MAFWGDWPECPARLRLCGPLLCWLGARSNRRKDLELGHPHLYPRHLSSTRNSVSAAIKNFKLHLKINWQPWVVYVPPTSVTQGLEGQSVEEGGQVRGEDFQGSHGRRGPLLA